MDHNYIEIDLVSEKKYVESRDIHIMCSLHVFRKRKEENPPDISPL
jgi:hypothetical protein